MPFKEPAIAWRPALLARTFQAAFPVMSRLLLESPKVQFATKPVAVPERITVLTRYGDIPALLYSPMPAEVEAERRPPVQLLLHGGAFVVRRPEQEDNVARYLASEVGCYVVAPDYDVSPLVRFRSRNRSVTTPIGGCSTRPARTAGTSGAPRSAGPARAPNWRSA